MMLKNILEKMIERFLPQKKTLQPRQKILMISAVLIGVWLIFTLIFSGTAAISSLQESLSSNRSLLIWMNSHASMVEEVHLKNNAYKSAGAPNLLGLLDKSLRDNHLESSLQKSEQLSDQKIHLIFTAVSFDTLMTWLMDLRTTANLKVSTFSAQLAGQPGRVNAEVILSLQGS